MKWSEVRWSEVKWSEVRWSEVKWGEVKCEVKCEVKWSEVKREVKWSEVKWSEVKWRHVKLSGQIGSCDIFCLVLALEATKKQRLSAMDHTKNNDCQLWVTPKTRAVSYGSHQKQRLSAMGHTKNNGCQLWVTPKTPAVSYGSHQKQRLSAMGHIIKQQLSYHKTKAVIPETTAVIPENNSYQLWVKPGNNSCQLWVTSGNNSCQLWVTPGNNSCQLWVTPGNNSCQLWVTPENNSCQLWVTPGNNSCQLWVIPGSSSWLLFPGDQAGGAWPPRSWMSPTSDLVRFGHVWHLCHYKGLLEKISCCHEKVPSQVPRCFGQAYVCELKVLIDLDVWPSWCFLSAHSESLYIQGWKAVRVHWQTDGMLSLSALMMQLRDLSEDTWYLLSATPWRHQMSYDVLVEFCRCTLSWSLNWSTDNSAFPATNAAKLRSARSSWHWRINGNMAPWPDKILEEATNLLTYLLMPIAPSGA